jgi:hypothetical protein
MQRTHKLITATACFSLALAACGGSKAPPIDQVKEDFNSPSGSTKDKQSVAGAYSKQSNSGSTAGLAVGGFAGGGFGLTNSNDVWSRISVHHHMRQLARSKLGLRSYSLSEAQDTSGCGIPSDATASGGETSGSVSYTIDFSTCGASGVTGKMTVDGTYELDQAAGIFKYNVDETLEDVCSGGVCVTGSISLESEFSFSNLGGTDSSASLVAGWFYTITEDGKTYETKGGLQLDAQGSGAGKFDYLVYVKDSSGAEVSLVISYESDANGNASIKIKGSDGEIACTVDAEGNGMCSGELSWTDEEADTFGEALYEE